MKTNNAEGLTIFEINLLIQQGGRFVMFPYTISRLVKKLPAANIYFVRPEENTFKYALKHFLLNLAISWRATPLAPLYIIKSIYFLIIGGKDYTQTILNDMKQNDPVYNPDSYELQYI